MKNIINRFNNKIRVVYDFIKNSYTLENIFLYFLAKQNSKRYRYVNFANIRNHIKQSDTVVIYGTGRSILDITQEQWDVLSKFNSISIGSFAQHNKYVDIDINHFREIGSYNYIYEDSRVANWEETLDYARNINDSNLFKNTVHLFQNGVSANASNRFIYSELLKFGSAYTNYSSNRRHNFKLTDKVSVLSHLSGSLGEAINIAYQLKWKNIILAGIDLKDRQYFYLNQNETSIWDRCRNEESSNRHNMADSTIKSILSFKQQLDDNDINISVLNKNSLLTEILPIYEFKE